MEVRFPEHERLPAWKIAFFQYAIALAFLGLLVGYWRIQIGQHRFFLDQAERNRVRNLPVIAPRGRILDREGRVLADNFPAFSVLLMRENASTLTAERLEGIRRGLDLDPDELHRLIDHAARLPRFQPIVLKQSATLDDITFVESHRLEYPELDLIQVQQRLYPRKEVAAATLGYVGEVSEEMIAKAGSPYRPGDVAGKFGIEREYDQILSGQDGLRRVIVNSRGEEMGSLNTINATPGNDLRLTVDLDLQMVAEAALGEKPGAVVALDPRTGEVLAMVSHPSFDPNEFAKRIDREEWEKLADDPMKPMMNKAIQAQLAPGSVFKIVTATAALETGTIQPDFTLNCSGQVEIYGHVYHDGIEKYKSHGSVDLPRAITVSCDVYFYTLGKLLGIEKLAYFAKRLGLGARTGIDLPSEAPGLIPTPAWVEKVFKHKWYAGETMSVAIGQGAVVVTPLQLARMIGGVAAGGVFCRPHLVFKDQLLALGVDPPDESAQNFPLADSTLEVVKRGMWGVVNEDGGTGIEARCPGIDIGGKTGTAQVASVDLMKSAHSADFKTNAWFVGFAPASQPEIAVAALVLHGGHSTVAVPVAREVIKAYFDKKNGQKPLVAPAQTQERVLSKAGELQILPPAVGTAVH